MGLLLAVTEVSQSLQGELRIKCRYSVGEIYINTKFFMISFSLICAKNENFFSNSLFMIFNCSRKLSKEKTMSLTHYSVHTFIQNF